MPDFDIFLNKNEKSELLKWENDNEDYSFTNIIMYPIWKLFMNFVPSTVAPNAITLSGFLCVLNSFYLCVRYMEVYPKNVSILSFVLCFSYSVLIGLDSMQAKATDNKSCLGHLFQEFVINTGVVFQTLILCYILDINDLNFQWYIVQIIVSVLLISHIRSLNTGKVIDVKFFSYRDVLTVFQFFLLFRIVGAFEPLYYVYSHYVYPLLTTTLMIPIREWTYVNGIKYDGETIAILYAVRGVYYICIMLVLFSLAYLKKEQRETRNSIIIIFSIRCVPGIMMYFSLYEMDLFHIVTDGLFTTMIASEIVVSRLCKKSFHPWIVVFAVASVMSHFIIICVVSFYHIVLLFEIGNYLNLPIFTINTNVYIDGVYDMCHYGHFKYFERALKEGTRLFVGVLSDESVEAYKRTPIMNLEERCAVVETCKSVYKVIPNAPGNGIPLKFIKKHNIHKVLCSEEYNNSKDHYYKVPRELGILKPMSRTEGMSTSELIRRIEKKTEERIYKKLQIEKENKKDL